MDGFDGFKSIKAYLYEKSTSPLAGAFAAAWLVLNHRVLFMLFSDEHYSKSFAAIDKYFARPLIEVSDEPGVIVSLVNWTAPFVYGVVCPLLLALAYIYLYPVIAEPVYEHSLRKRKRLRELKQAADRQRLLSHEESAELYARMERIRTEAETNASRYGKEIDALNMTIQQLNSEVDQLSSKDHSELSGSSEDGEDDGGSDSYAEKRDIYVDDPKDPLAKIELPDEQIKVLVAISDGTIGHLRNSFDISAQRINFAQDQLVRHNLIDNGPGGWFATPEGREWLELHGRLR